MAHIIVINGTDGYPRQLGHWSEISASIMDYPLRHWLETSDSKILIIRMGSAVNYIKHQN